MLVRDTGDAWQVVMQTDHGEHAGQLAAAWHPRPEPFRSLEIVARRHDDGWLMWERAPRLDANGRPCNYLDVEVPSHLAFHRAAIVAVREHDPYAALVLAMHTAGIYRQRYGVQPDLRMTFVEEVQQLADEFVAEREDEFEAWASSLEVADEQRWHSYKLLQAWDRLSLFCCLNDLESESPPTEGTQYSSLGVVPIDGIEQTLTLRPRGRWRVAVDPFPFGPEPAEFTLQRRIVPKRAWDDDDAFRKDLFAATLERVALVMEPA